MKTALCIGKIFPTLFLLAGLLFVSGCSAGSSGTTYTEQLQEMISAEWQSYAATHVNWGGGASLYIIAPAENYFVYTDYPAGKVMTPVTHFRAASTTKTFTAAAIMLLHQEGLINIDHLLTDMIPGTATPYLPDSATYAIPFKNQITIRQLLGHRGGVFDVTNENIPLSPPPLYAGKRYLNYVREDLGDNTHTFTFDELASVVSSNGLAKYPPAQQFSYSNTGYMLLGLIIERVSGKRFHQFVTDNFITPLALKETSLPYIGTDMTIPAPYADGFVWSSNSLFPATDDNMSGNVAEGNMISSLRDLAKWNRLLLRAEAGLHSDIVAQMMNCEPTYEQHQYYGLGITYTPGLGYGHNGGHIGFITVMRYDPQYDATFVLSASVMNADNIYEQIDWMYGIVFNARVILGFL